MSAEHIAYERAENKKDEEFKGKNFSSRNETELIWELEWSNGSLLDLFPCWLSELNNWLPAKRLVFGFPQDHLHTFERVN